jgi:hypothetical protein
MHNNSHNSADDHTGRLDLLRLEKLCELLTSPHAAERAVAADKATALLIAADMTWTDLMLRERDTSSEKSTTRAGSKSSTKQGMYAAGTVSELYMRLEDLTEWEQEFICNLHRYGKTLTLSDKQWAVVIRLAVKAGVIAGAAA